MTATDLTRELTRHAIAYERIPHPRTESARDEALEVGLAEVAKTIVVVAPRGRVRAVLPAGARLDLAKLSAVVGSELRLASEGELAEAYPMFELGAVPPLGGPSGERTVLDRRLALRDTIVIEAGSHEESLRLRTRDVVCLAEAMVADICA